MRADVDISFIAHPLTGDIPTKTGSEAIKQAIRNIVLTSFGERGFNIEFGTNVRSSLFELMDHLQLQTIKDSIGQALKNFEPHAELVDLTAKEYENSLEISIFYNEVNTLEQKIVTVRI